VCPDFSLFQCIEIEIDCDGHNVNIKKQTAERFGHWFLQQYEINPLFISLVLLTDEAGFTRDGTVDREKL
jgi:hypothetical protein